MTLTRYSCGHVGAELGQKMKMFIRFAEIRRNRVEVELHPCPDCRQVGGPA